MAQRHTKGTETSHGKTRYGASFSGIDSAKIAVHIPNNIFYDVIFPIISLPIITAGIIHKPAITSIR